MAKVLLVYNIPQGSDNLRIRFTRQLFSTTISSHNGKYTSTTKGILKEYEKPARGCVLFDSKHKKAVTQLCKTFGIQATFYNLCEDKTSEKILFLLKKPIRNDTKRIQFARGLCTTIIPSHSHKYYSKTHGVLDEFEKPGRAIVVFNKQKLSDVKKYCQANNAQAVFFEVEAQ